MTVNLTRAQRIARMLRAHSGLSQRVFERATRVPNIGAIEDGDRNPSTTQLTRMASILGLTLADCEEMLRDYEVRRERRLTEPERKPTPWFPAPGIEEVVNHYAARFASRQTGARRAAERAQALAHWRRLETLVTFEDMVLVVRMSRAFQSWALVELLCDESVRAASKDGLRALLLADVALEAARHLRVREGWRRRLQAFAKAHLANAYRVLEDFDAADRTMAEAWVLWLAGKDPEGLLDPGRLLELEASLRRAQRRFADSLALLEKAAPLTRQPEYLALSAAFTREVMGDYAGAIAILRKAERLVKNHPEARLRTIQRFNLAAALTHVEGGHREAARIVPVVQRLAKELGDELDLIRTKWLEGRVLAGLGRTAKALEALEEARGAFSDRNLHYDVALCLLEMAVLHLERGELDEVKRLAAELVPVFKAKRIHREALAALRLFSIAAKRQAATAGFTRDLLDYFFRARHDKALCFRTRALR
jgi:tetratricopeptide (TPR) repeat protein